MKENISINGNETIEELVKKVNTVESIDEKLSICIMIISYLEVKNSVRPGSYTNKIGLSKEFPPLSPEEIEKLNQINSILGKTMGDDINNFLFYLKKTETNCYDNLVSTYEKISKKNDQKEKMMFWGVIVGFIIVIYFLSKI